MGAQLKPSRLQPCFTDGRAAGHDPAATPHRVACSASLVLSIYFPPLHKGGIGEEIKAVYTTKEKEHTAQTYVYAHVHNTPRYNKEYRPLRWGPSLEVLIRAPAAIQTMSQTRCAQDCT